MNKKIIIPLIVLLLSSILINFEMQRYEFFDNNEFDTIRPYDKISEIMNKKIEETKARKQEDKIKLFQINRKTEDDKISKEAIQKYGIKIILNPKDEIKNEKERKILCKTLNFQCSIEAGYNEKLSPAVAFDLNNDGTDEIIGTVNGCCGHTGCSLFIIQKDGNQYKTIYDTGAWTKPFPIIIINHKTNGYYDFITTMIDSHSGGRKTLVKFNALKNEYE